MPREYKRASSSRTYRDYSTEKLDSALKLIRAKKITQRNAAKHFKIPRSTLKYKLKGEHRLPFGGHKALTDKAENAIVQYCIVMNDYGFPLDTYDLRFKQSMPEIEWIRSSLKRNKNISLRFSSNINKTKASLSSETINQFFNHMSKELDSIQPSNIWNYDETNLTDDPALPKLKRQEGNKVLLGDNFSSHMSWEVINSCKENLIAFVCLPPNSTHLTQPLDIAFYKPLKLNWRKVLTAWKLNTSTQSSVMSKDQFPRQLKQLHESIEGKAADNIISGFRKAGIYPLDREKLSELRTDTAKEPRRKKGD
ncbi:Laminin subunit alpha-1-like [Oopsacas minuta]|uniref:Laminin subunit alpha-1-like n=1 Tax=Oopsacas minuta TaxID=111878 RepID=A0AAV7JQX9_9METZ|nr:Laminin subunit alpha-1-like [Oopsacas minuta]